jgi:hypothetical protein
LWPDRAREVSAGNIGKRNTSEISRMKIERQYVETEKQKRERERGVREKKKKT